MKTLIQAAESRPRFKERQWLGAIFALWVGILIADGPVARGIDYADANWLQAEIDLERLPDSTWRVWYRTEASEETWGQWSAYPQLRAGLQRMRGGQGQGSYSPDRFLIKAWSWEAFFGEDIPVPESEFRVCVFYRLERASGATRITPIFCSEWVTP